MPAQPIPDEASDADRPGAGASRPGPRSFAPGWIRIRPLAAGETGPVQAVFDAMGPRARFLRYHAPWPRLPGTMLRYLSGVAAERHEAFVATQEGRPVALARWIRDDEHPDRAELALEVADGCQGRGIGRALATVTARAAEGAGVRVLSCHVHAENRLMRSWLQRLGARPVAGDPDEFRLPVERLARVRPGDGRRRDPAA